MSVVKNLRDETVEIFDGDTPENSITLVCDGPLSWQDGGEAVVQIKDRGAISHLRPGEEQPVKGSLKLLVKEYLTQGANAVTPYEAVKGIGGAAAWLTTNDDGGGVRTFGIRVTIATPTDGEEAEKITFAKCFIEPGGIKSDSAMDGNTLNFDFTDNELTPTIAKISESS